jgi:hypothetical protein
VEKELVLYGQTRYSPYVALARDLLTRYKIPFREIDVQAQPTMAERVTTWTGRLSLPTLIVAAPGSDLPLAPPAPLDPGQAPRGIDRDSLISEPNNQQLEDWLYKQGFLDKPYKR